MDASSAWRNATGLRLPHDESVKRTPMAPGTERERGDTLVEILVALAILGVGIVALVGALGTNVTTTVVNRSQAKAETTLLAASEYVKALAPFTFACGGSAVALTTEVPHDAAFAITYGPPAQVGGTACAKLVRVPVTVTGDGFRLTVDVVKRA
jgi:prepilin-type N-terminal cleavage/methylation domain-containing protein